jgi:hypothetical protein
MAARGTSAAGIVLALALCSPVGTAVLGVAQEECPSRAPAELAQVLDDGALRAVFLDLVGRPPFLRERERWLGQGRSTLVDELLGGEEFWRQWCEEQLYYFLLIDNFRPDSERLRELPADLAGGRASVRDAIQRIALSPSFDQRNPGADTFVTVVLEQIVGIRVQSEHGVLEIGKVVYDGGQGHFLGKSGSSQADVVRIAVEDERFERHLLARESRRWLGVELPASDLAGAARVLRRSPLSFTDLVRSWFTGPAYAERLARGRALENRVFVNALFVDLLDRLPSADELGRLRGALYGLADPLPLRAVLARLLIESGQVELPAKGEIEDPTAWVGGLFRRLLGRAAGPEELAAFVEVFHEPDCQPQTILYALVSHPEYHLL